MLNLGTSSATTQDVPARRNWLISLLAIVAVFAASLAGQVAVGAPQADAINSFDSQILDFINDFRQREGLNPLLEHPPLSQAANAWAGDVEIRTDGDYCSDLNTPVYDSQANVSSQGTPAGTVQANQAAAVTCGIVGFGAGVDGGGESRFPECQELRDWTEAVDQWCELTFSDDGMAALENPALSHIGLGSRRTTTDTVLGEERGQFTAFRFATVITGCEDLTITIDMNTNGGVGVGTQFDDVILGTPGDDIIDAGGGNDIVCAGGGSDQVVAGAGDDVVFGEDGDDVIRGNAGVDSLSGGPGNDRVLGGTDGDTLNGGDGDDFIGGFGGPDAIDGGPGNDKIFGGFGSDTIYGRGGHDVIRGLIGDDVIHGGPGNDSLDGDRGNDVINGDEGSDTINGGNGNDILSGGGGDDVLNGGKADDMLSGGGGIDACTGNKHNVADSVDSTCNTFFGIP